MTIAVPIEAAPATIEHSKSFLYGDHHFYNAPGRTWAQLRPQFTEI
jgi:hypothetical protein